MFPTLAAALAHHADTIPEQRFTRILKSGLELQSRTFAEMWAWAGQWAALFADRGLGRGDTAVIALPNSDAFVGAYYGCLMAGCTPAPIAPLRRVEENDPYLHTVVERLSLVKAKALVVQDDQATPEARSGPALSGIHLLTAAQLDPTRLCTQPRSTPDDIALIQFTSGTSGNPKAVVLSQRALVAQVQMIRDQLRLEDRFQDRGVSWLPLFHDMGLIGFLLTPGYAGGEVTLLQPEDFVLRPSLWLKALTDYAATITGGPPSAYALCAKRLKATEAGQYDLSSVRVALVGAEMVTRESVTAFCEKFQPAGFRASAMIPTYGLAENSLAVTMPPLGAEPCFDALEADRLAEGVAQPVRAARPSGSGTPLPSGRGRASVPGIKPNGTFAGREAPGRAAATDDPANVRWFASVGPPLPGVALQIVDGAGQPLPERRVGEIILQSPCMMNGYYHNEPETRLAIREGWLYTGDLGYLAQGQLYVTGRKKEVIIVGGRSYYPDDVEQVLGEVPGVRRDRAVAIGVVDAEWATEKLIVLAETDRTEPAERDGLRMDIRRTLLDAGYPVSEVVLLKPKSIQSTLTGKLKRIDCKTRYLAGEFAGRH